MNVCRGATRNHGLKADQLNPALDGVLAVQHHEVGRAVAVVVDRNRVVTAAQIRLRYVQPREGAEPLFSSTKSGWS